MAIGAQRRIGIVDHDLIEKRVNDAAQIRELCERTGVITLCHRCAYRALLPQQCRVQRLFGRQPEQVRIDPVGGRILAGVANLFAQDVGNALVSCGEARGLGALQKCSQRRKSRGRIAR